MQEYRDSLQWRHVLIRPSIESRLRGAVWRSGALKRGSAPFVTRFRKSSGELRTIWFRKRRHPNTRGFSSSIILNGSVISATIVQDYSILRFFGILDFLQTALLRKRTTNGTLVQSLLGTPIVQHVSCFCLRGFCPGV